MRGRRVHGRDRLAAAARFGIDAEGADGQGRGAERLPDLVAEEFMREVDAFVLGDGQGGRVVPFFGRLGSGAVFVLGPGADSGRFFGEGVVRVGVGVGGIRVGGW